MFTCFLQFGNIYEVRMMMDFNGNNRGYAFVTFSTKQEAKNAMKQLNNYEIRWVTVRPRKQTLKTFVLNEFMFLGWDSAKQIITR